VPTSSTQRPPGLRHCSLSGNQSVSVACVSAFPKKFCRYFPISLRTARQVFILRIGGARGRNLAVLRARWRQVIEPPVREGYYTCSEKTHFGMDHELRPFLTPLGGAH